MSETDTNPVCDAFNELWQRRHAERGDDIPLTVGELKRMLEDVDDEAVVVRWDGDDFSQSYGQYFHFDWGYMVPLWETTEEMRKMSSKDTDPLGDYADKERLAEFNEEHPDCESRPAEKLAVVL